MIRYPNIIGKTDAQKLEQMRSYLHQLADELNFQLDRTGNLASGYVSSANEEAKPIKKNNAVSNFNDIKALIIKSADIVNAYYEEINKRLKGVYVAEATFPSGSATFIEETEQNIVANSSRIDQLFTDLKAIVSDIAGIENTLIETEANIRTGHLFNAGEESSVLDDNIPEGVPVFGVEVGQETTKDGVKVFDKYARFTAFGMILYDENGNETVYLTNNQTHIPNAKIGKSLVVGGFIDEVDKDGGIVTKWVGG